MTTLVTIGVVVIAALWLRSKMLWTLDHSQDPTLEKRARMEVLLLADFASRHRNDASGDIRTADWSLRLRSSDPGLMNGFRMDGSRSDNLLDPWDHPYISDGIVNDRPRFHSLGIDGVDQHGAEGSDDIVSWR